MQGLKILVRTTNWVGDAVMSLPALQAIRGAYPTAHIAVLARSWVADIYARESFADETTEDIGSGDNDCVDLALLGPAF